MLEKTKEKRKRAERLNQWTGYKPTATPTKREKQIKQDRKEKRSGYKEKD